MRFTSALKELMRANGYTQTALAVKLGTTQQTVSRWLKGINQPDFETLFVLCKLLDSTPNELLGWEE